MSESKPEPCGYCPTGRPCTLTESARRAGRGACMRFYTEAELSPVICRGCGKALPRATANAGERTHPTCSGDKW